MKNTASFSTAIITGARCIATGALCVAAGAFSYNTAGAQVVATPFGTPIGQPAPRNAVPAATAAPSNANTNNINAGTAGNYTSGTVEGQSDKLFNVNSDSVDFENGTFQWKGRTFNIGNSKLMRAFFDSYLAAPAPTDDANRYEAILTEIETLLSPQKLNQQNYAASLQRAWNLLYEAAKFDADGDASSTLATLIYKTSQMRRELYARERNDLYLRKDKDKKLHDLTGHRTSLEREKEAAKRHEVKKGNTVTTTTTIPPDKGAARTAELAEFLAESRKNIVVNQAEYTTLGLRSRLEFQSQIVAYLIGRRFHHANIACAFYRNMFTGSNQQLRVGEKQVKEFFPVSGFIPTIDSVEMLAKEAIKDVQTRMRAVTALYDSGQRFNAFERLQETYFLGQYEPLVMFFDPQKKAVLRQVWSNARELQRLGDERDLVACDQYINTLKELATDFPAVAIKSKVDAAKQASDLALLDAQIAALNRDSAGASEKLQVARKIWPLNPGLKDFATRIRNQANLLVQKAEAFDRYLAAGQLREIYKDKMEMGVAFTQDKERAEKLKAIVERFAKLETLIAQARVLDAQRNSAMAWDYLLEAAKVDPADAEVMKLRVELATKTGRYSQLLDKAAALEKSGNHAAALAVYLAAQELNKLSIICQQGIDRTSDNLIGKTERHS